jgi:hypothetical protein
VRAEYGLDVLSWMPAPDPGGRSDGDPSPVSEYDPGKITGSRSLIPDKSPVCPLPQVGKTRRSPGVYQILVLLRT